MKGKIYAVFVVRETQGFDSSRYLCCFDNSLRVYVHCVHINTPPSTEAFLCFSNGMRANGRRTW